MTNRADHWNNVYGARSEEALTWFETSPTISADLIAQNARPGDAIIDVGGGASRLVDRLLAQGLGPITVLDLAESALASSRARLGAAAENVAWITADITRWNPPQRYRLWHDRAVFHFLTETSDRAAYIAAMDQALAPGGIAIIATFAEDGPQTCSGLPIIRYTPEALADTIDLLAPGQYVPIAAQKHVHETPKGNRQNFQISVLRKKP